MIHKIKENILLGYVQKKMYYFETNMINCIHLYFVFNDFSADCHAFVALLRK